MTREDLDRIYPLLDKIHKGKAKLATYEKGSIEYDALNTAITIWEKALMPFYINKGMGRTRLTDTAVKEAIDKCGSMEAAAAYLDVSLRTVYRYKSKLDAK